METLGGNTKPSTEATATYDKEPGMGLPVATKKKRGESKHVLFVVAMSLAAKMTTARSCKLATTVVITTKVASYIFKY